MLAGDNFVCLNQLTCSLLTCLNSNIFPIIILSEQLAYRVTFTGVKKAFNYEDLEEAFGVFGHVGQWYMDISPFLDDWSGTGYVDFLSEDAARDASAANAYNYTLCNTTTA